MSLQLPRTVNADQISLSGSSSERLSCVQHWIPPRVSLFLFLPPSLSPSLAIACYLLTVFMRNVLLLSITQKEIRMIRVGCEERVKTFLHPTSHQHPNPILTLSQARSNKQPLFVAVCLLDHVVLTPVYSGLFGARLEALLWILCPEVDS